MRILLVSDIHANWPALAAVREPHDVCLFLGDLVDYGTDPAPCIDWVRRHAHHSVRGNHDHGAAQGVTVTGGVGYRFLTGATRPVTRGKLSEADRRFLADLPVTKALTLDHKRLLLVHATPRDPLDEVAPPDPAFWARRLGGVTADVVCVGHTHQQYALEVGRTLVINPGSIGLSRDGDPRAAYAVLDGGRVELRRAEYPVEEAVRVVEASPLPDRAKELLAAAYRTGSLPQRNGTAGANGQAAAFPPRNSPEPA
jgi:putative phosphoesterase